MSYEFCVVFTDIQAHTYMIISTLIKHCKTVIGTRTQYWQGKNGISEVKELKAACGQILEFILGILLVKLELRRGGNVL